MLLEVVGGLWAGSLALLADATHMLSDTVALGLAFAASRIALRPPDGARSYGYQRASVLSAFVNGLTLVALAAWITIEAIQRLAAPEPVLGGLMLAVAIAGLVANLLALAILHGGDRNDINLRGALLHVLGDLLGSLAAIAAAVTILWTAWYPIDPLLSLLVAVLILRSAWDLLRRSGHILLEGAPADLDPDQLSATILAEIAPVRGVHHVHAWSLAPGRPLLTLHVDVSPGTDTGDVLRRVKTLLARRFGIHHSTIQVETEGKCGDAVCDAAAGPVAPWSEKA